MQCHTSADKCAPDQQIAAYLLRPHKSLRQQRPGKNADSHAQQNTRAAYQNNDLSHLSAQSADPVNPHRYPCHIIAPLESVPLV